MMRKNNLKLLQQFAECGMEPQQPNPLQYYIDAHTHLLDYPPPIRTQIIQNALQNNVKKISVNCTTSKQYDSLIELTNQHTDLIIGGIGVHPYFVSEELSYYGYQDEGKDLLPREQWRNRLVSQLEKNESLTVGEIGLDFRKDVVEKNPKFLQNHLFLEQLHLAIKLKRPVTIHCVRAYGQVLKIFKKLNKGPEPQSKPAIIMHSYGGSKQITQSLLKLDKLNIYFSLSLKRTIQLCEVIPLDRVVCETDSPCQNNIELLTEMELLHKNKYYQALQKQTQFDEKYIKNESNEPTNVIANIKSIALKYKALLGLEQKQITRIIAENTLRAFKLLK